MPRLKTETFGAGDLSWLGSTHGIANGRTEKLDISTFTSGTHYPNGYLPSGLPVALVSGVLVPYVATEGTTTGSWRPRRLPADRPGHRRCRGHRRPGDRPRPRPRVQAAHHVRRAHR